MREMWIVIRREFREGVRTRAFILSTVLLPLFIGAIFLVPYLVERTGGEDYRIAVVDETEEGIGARIGPLLAAAGDSGGDTVEVDYLPRALTELEDSLRAMVRAEVLDGYIVLDRDVVSTGMAAYRGRVVTNMGLMESLEGAASQAVRVERLDRAGLDPAQVTALLSPVRLQITQITRQGGTGGGFASTLIIAYIVTFVLYFFIVLYGAQVMQSVHEEKGQRIAEVLMSSVSAPQLLAGKIVGVGSAAILQLLVWGGFAGIILWQRERIAAGLGLPLEAIASLEPDLLAAVPVLLFALLGFFLYAGLYATVAAATDSNQDAQQFVWILVLPLMLPLILQFQLISEPQGTVATVLGWIPLTAPLAMPLRMGAGQISGLEIVGPMVVLGIAVAGASWMAGKIYRIGMLSIGQRASFGQIWRWLKY